MTQTIQPTINVMQEAHKMAKAVGAEYGHYSVRLKAAIKQVWAMVKEAAKFNPEIKANTGAVKTTFSEEKVKQEKENLVTLESSIHNEFKCVVIDGKHKSEWMEAKNATELQEWIKELFYEGDTDYREIVAEYCPH